jgi:hypothetical protein
MREDMGFRESFNLHQHLKSVRGIMKIIKDRNPKLEESKEIPSINKNESSPPT